MPKANGSTSPSPSTSAPSSTWSMGVASRVSMPSFLRNMPEQRLAVGQPADAEVAEERLGA